jgi:hypothetical protein
MFHLTRKSYRLTIINVSKGKAARISSTFSRIRLHIQVLGADEHQRLMGADTVPNQIELDELIAYLHEELGHIEQAILTLERMAMARAAHPVLRLTGQRVPRARTQKARVSHRLRTGKPKG